MARLNSKLKARDVEVHDLVRDLSDGVSGTPNGQALVLTGRWC